MEYLTVENWSKYQHYKAERPAWIKWYREVTNDLAWLAMRKREPERGEAKCQHV